MMIRSEAGRGPSKSAPRSGFTLIELTSVVAVIALLIALLLPAIQSSREQARRLQCINNMTQLGLALNNYASSHRVLPPGIVDWKGPIDNSLTGYRVGWIVQILPFVEMGNLWNQFNFRMGIPTPANATAQRRYLNVLLCPSDGSAVRFGTNYAGCHHDVEAAIDVNNHGVLYLNSKIRLDEIPDGPGYTILVGEFRRGNVGSNWASGNRSTLRNTGYRINSVESLYSPPVLVNEAEPNPTEANTTALTTEPVVADSASDNPALWFVGSFNSHHPGGANFLFCDGSIRFLKQRIVPGIYQALGNRNDGLLISDDQF